MVTTHIALPAEPSTALFAVMEVNAFTTLASASQSLLTSQYPSSLLLSASAFVSASPHVLLASSNKDTRNLTLMTREIQGRIKSTSHSFRKLAWLALTQSLGSRLLRDNDGKLLI